MSKIVEVFKGGDGRRRERLECGHIVERLEWMGHYTPERRRCADCALHMKEASERTESSR